MEFKLYVILFILFVVIRNGTLNNIISKISSGNDDSNTISIVIEGIFLVLAYMFAELLVTNDYL